MTRAGYAPGSWILTNLGTRSIISSLTELSMGPTGGAVGQYLWCWVRDGLVLIHLKAWARARRRLASILHVAGCALLVGALIGCQGNGHPPTPTTTVAPAVTTAPSPTASASPTPTATATLTPTATATSTPTPTPLPEFRLLSPMAHEYQGWNNCAAVSVEMVLSYYGIQRGQYEIAAVLRPYRDDKHVGTDEMLEYLRAAGLEGRVLVNGSAERLQAFIASDIPVIIRTILQPGDDIGHYVVIRGYDHAAQTLIANDSYYGPERAVSEEALEAIWAPFNHSYIPVYRPAQAEEVCRILGEDCSEEGMYRRAEQAARAWTEHAPGDAYAWYCLGDDLLALGQPEAALDAYAKAEAIGLPPRTYWYRFGPFEARLAAKRYQELLATSQAVLATLPCIEELNVLRGRAYEALGERDKAVEEYRLAFRYHTNYRPAVEALQRLGAELPPTPTPTPIGTPNIPSTLVPLPTLTPTTPAAGGQPPAPAVPTPAGQG